MRVRVRGWAALRAWGAVRGQQGSQDQLSSLGFLARHTRRQGPGLLSPCSSHLDTDTDPPGQALPAWAGLCWAVLCWAGLRGPGPSSRVC